MALRPPPGPRSLTAGPDSGPEAPFPIHVSGPVIKGFGRGSKELGIPTANLPVSGLSIGGHSDLASGVYFGFASLHPSFFSMHTIPEDINTHPGVEKTQKNNAPVNNKHETTPIIFPAVLSLGYNPFYANTVRSLEIHLLSPNPSSSSTTDESKPIPSFTLPDFYGTRMHLLILGFIRPEYNYDSLESLVKDIKIDGEVARKSLAREGYAQFEQEKWLIEYATENSDVNGVHLPSENESNGTMKNEDVMKEGKPETIGNP
ncbi:MAG: riboflavin kinase [Cirrosporium novae-zelandiae]|nr:MAG: riboflavin kinase [Cirrosporium novae-zelandiae]